MKITYTAAEADDGRKVYSVLKKELALSATLIKRLKSTGGITVDGEAAFTDYRLKPGETVEAELSLSEREPDFLPEHGELQVLFENDWLIAVNKPAGMLVHPSRSKYTGTLAGLVSGYLLDKEGSSVCHTVNRLDRDTSGVVLFAKSAYAKTLAVRALSEPDAKKEYRAILFGALPESQGTIDLPIARLREGEMERGVLSNGQRAVTHYRQMRQGIVLGEKVSEASFLLDTGRTHQIRVHCRAMGAPILGDALYGNDASRTLSEAAGVSAQLLHAYELTFRDIQSGELVTITAPVIRKDMDAVAELAVWED
ncbi:MAG: RluA family pseudouridine synthase [Oscillospiraceae bacterium]